MFGSPKSGATRLKHGIMVAIQECGRVTVSMFMQHAQHAINTVYYAVDDQHAIANEMLHKSVLCCP